LTTDQNAQPIADCQRRRDAPAMRLSLAFARQRALGGVTAFRRYGVPPIARYLPSDGHCGFFSSAIL